MRDKKNILIGVLIFAVVVMAFGYATFSTSFAKGGQVNVTNAWDVAITNCRRVDQSAKEEVEDEGSTPSHTITTATLDTSLKSFEAWAEYEITITNKGSVDAELDTANVLSAIQSKITDAGKSDVLDGDFVRYEITKVPDSYLKAPTKDEKINSTTMKIKVMWDSTSNEEVINSVEEKLTINVVYKQAS
jgi:hypothetical protein